MAEPFTLKGLLAVALVVGLGVLAHWARGRILADRPDLGTAFRERLLPRLKEAVTWLGIATLVVWAAIYITASEADRRRLGDDMAKLFRDIAAPAPPQKEEGPAPK